MTGVRVFDCFTFFNELDMLELRLRHHWNYVDHFVICEANQTFRGAPKPLHFQDNIERYREYLPKIIHVAIDDFPDTNSPWDREHFQRTALARGLEGASLEDQIIVSDCDELLSHEALSRLREMPGFVFFDMAMYQFFVNMRAAKSGWLKAYAFRWGDRDKLNWGEQNKSMNFNVPRQLEKRFYDGWPGEKQIVENAGWHFTFLGGVGQVTAKLLAYSHSEEWQRKMLDERVLEDQLIKLRDVGGGRFLDYCEVDQSFPMILRANYRHYADIGFIKTTSQRIRELESIMAETTNHLKSMVELSGRVNYFEAIDRLIKQDAESRYTNLALGKPCVQSSASIWSHFNDPAADAAGAVNGLVTGGYGFHTSLEVNPWWQVDLATPCRISRICIINRVDEAQRLNHFTLLVSTDGLGWTWIGNRTDDQVFGAQISDPYVIDLDPPIMGRYVHVRLDGENYLHFNQCMVFGSVSPP